VVLDVDIPDDDSDPGECRTWYRDLDHDGFGDPEEPTESCDVVEGFVTNALDCDDSDETVNPAMVDICNGVDDDCTGEADEGFDQDQDGFQSLDCPTGIDCDDADPAIHPDAEEICEDGVDNDCVGGDKACDALWEGELDLGDADIKLWADTAGYDAGRRMDAMDMDGDGDDEIAVSAMWANGYQGGAYILDGPLPERDTLTQAGVWLPGDSASYEGARSLALADGTGDGLGDVLMGGPDSPGYDTVLMFGPITETIAWSDAPLRFTCQASIECGHGADFADVDGDGVADAVIGAGEQTHGGSSSGSVYFIYGPLETGTHDLDTRADAELIGQSAGIETGRVVMAGDDMNGDGIGDIMASASYDSESGYYAGAVLVNYGPAIGVKDMDQADGKLLGENNYDYAGEIIGQGDVNGDGLFDAIVSAFVADNNAGAVYVVFGPAAGWIHLGDAHVKIRGGRNDNLGTAVSARDIDGDDVGDLFIGASGDGENGGYSGSAHLFIGPLEGTVALADADATFFGERGQNQAGGGVGQADIDGDGFGELLIGAPGESTGGSAAGALYIQFAE